MGKDKLVHLRELPSAGAGKGDGRGNAESNSMTSLLETIDAMIADLEATIADPKSIGYVVDESIVCMQALKQVRLKVVEIAIQADQIRLAEVNCDANDMRDAIVSLLMGPDD